MTIFLNLTSPLVGYPFKISFKEPHGPSGLIRSYLLSIRTKSISYSLRQTKDFTLNVFAHQTNFETLTKEFILDLGSYVYPEQNLLDCKCTLIEIHRVKHSKIVLKVLSVVQLSSIAVSNETLQKSHPCTIDLQLFSVQCHQIE